MERLGVPLWYSGLRICLGIVTAAARVEALVQGQRLAQEISQASYVWSKKRGGMRDHKREQVDSSSKFGDIKAKQTSGFNPEVELKHAVTD